MNRTLENLATLTPTYIDNCDWRFYEGGINVAQINHAVRLEIAKHETDKIYTIVIHLTVGDEELILRMAPYEFHHLNDMFKRASFRLEKL